MSNYYYDSCVFGNALNPTWNEHLDCQRITDAGAITWRVCICTELTLCEVTFGDFVEQFLVQCGLHGVDVYDVPKFGIKRVAKKFVQHKAALHNYGFCGRDWKHLCAALVIPCDYLVSTDEDFFDPANKRVKNGSGNRVERYIRRHCAVTVRKPSAVR